MAKKRNTFVACVDYVAEPEMVSDTVKIAKGVNGIKLKLEIKRIEIIGTNIAVVFK